MVAEMVARECPVVIDFQQFGLELDDGVERLTSLFVTPFFQASQPAAEDGPVRARPQGGSHVEAVDRLIEQASPGVAISEDQPHREVVFFLAAGIDQQGQILGESTAPLEFRDQDQVSITRRQLARLAEGSCEPVSLAGLAGQARELRALPPHGLRNAFFRVTTGRQVAQLPREVELSVPCICCGGEQEELPHVGLELLPPFGARAATKGPSSQLPDSRTWCRSSARPTSVIHSERCSTSAPGMPEPTRNSIDLRSSCSARAAAAARAVNCSACCLACNSARWRTRS